MLTAATLGMFLYGIYSVATGIIDLVGPVSLDIWADIMLILLGGWLMIASAFVRIGAPGCLAFAMGSLFALQALSLHHTSHLKGAINLMPEFIRGALVAILILMAYLGLRKEKNSPSQ